MTSVSYFDLKNGDGQLYHVFMLGIFAGLKDSCIILSNREAGLGRYDVVIIPKDPAQDFAYLFELKVVLKAQLLEETAHKAIEQIKAIFDSHKK